MSSQEGMNESCRLIAKAKGLILKFLDKDDTEHDDIVLYDAMALLSDAIDKLTS